MERMKNKTKKTKKVTVRRKRTKIGSGFVNSLIDRMNFELHLPGYNFAGNICCIIVIEKLNTIMCILHLQ